ncbi:DMT family transporter [Candidatus Peregrinibacteria bacterium]|nr:DMT family transporter [Candidatus Peregrinibacteria bacterium]
MWVIFGLLAPLFWGIANIGDRYLSSVAVKNEYALTFAAGVLRLPLVIVFLWISGWFLPNLNSLIWVFISGFLTIFAYVFYFRAFQKEEASRVMLLYYTISPLVTFALSAVFLGERFSNYDLAGSLLLLVAAFLTVVKFQKGFFKFNIGILWVLLSGLFWPASDVIQKYLTPIFPSTSSLFAWTLAGSFIAGFVLLLMPDFSKNCKPNDFRWSKSSWLLFIINSALFFLGIFTFLKAIAIGKVALTVVLNVSQPLFVFIFELMMRKFRPTLWQVDTSTSSLIAKTTAFFLMVAGVWLFTFTHV